MPRLIGQSHEIAGKTFELTDALVSVGRTASNGVHIPDNSVSSHHAELRLEGFDYTLKDLESTNGTRVNGEKISSTLLRRHDLVRFGNVDLAYESEHDPVTVALPELSPGISLEGCASRGCPPHFSAQGLAKKAKKNSGSIWILLLVVAAFLAFIGVAYFIVTVTMNPIP
jgi:hypothetical protein